MENANVKCKLGRVTYSSHILSKYTDLFGRDGVGRKYRRYGLGRPEIEFRWTRDFLCPSRPVPRPTKLSYNG